MKRKSIKIRKNKLLCILLSAAAALCLTACGSSESALPDLSSLGAVTAVAREEGSGTKSEFQGLVDTDEEGAASIALSTDEMLEAVESDINAIGYAAYSALADQEAEGIKVLTIDGAECTGENIADGSYPLTREYIIAYSGTLSDLEADFITYIRSAGQEIVAQTATPVRNTAVFLSGGYSGTITISGSTSMETLMEQLIEDYAQYNPNAEIILEITDSTQGLNAAMQGECDLAMSSRSLASYEEELLDYYVIAADGIAIIVNSENPLEDLSIKRLKSIYDGDVSEWSNLE